MKPEIPSQRLLTLSVLTVFIVLSSLAAHRSAAQSNPSTTPVTARATSAPQTPPDPGADKGVGASTNTSVPKLTGSIPPYRQVFVVAAGVNQIPGFEALKFAEADAGAVANVFRQQYGFTNIVALTGTNATRARVMAEIESVGSRITPEDDFLFFFSGHGITVPEGVVTNGVTTIVARHGFLVSYDQDIRPNSARQILDQKILAMRPLVDAIRQLHARHRVVMIDSCFSGLAFVQQSLADARPSDLYRDVISHPTVQILTAGLDSETARENPIEGQGVFTAALLQQLRGNEIRTMEEVFFPLRVSVRNQTESIGAPMSMTPQHRYLLYTNGTFVFVPVGKLNSWASAKPQNEVLADASKKGYFRPVEISEVTNVVAGASETPAQRQERVDRYEARAAMGDPFAAKALAEIYGKGLGAPANPGRAKLYSEEANDYLRANGTADWASFMGIKDPVAAKAVNVFLGGNGPSLGGNLGGVAPGGDAVGMAAFALQMQSIFGGGGGGGDLESQRQQVLRLIGERKYANASKNLTELERRLGGLLAKFPTPPAQAVEIRQYFTTARNKIDLNLKDGALNALEQAGPKIAELMSLLPQKPKP